MGLILMKRRTVRWLFLYCHSGIRYSLHSFCNIWNHMVKRKGRLRKENQWIFFYLTRTINKNSYPWQCADLGIFTMYEVPVREYEFFEFWVEVLRIKRRRIKRIKWIKLREFENTTCSFLNLTCTGKLHDSAPLCHRPPNWKMPN